MSRGASRAARREPAGRERRPSRYEFSKVAVDFESAGTVCSGWLYRPDRPAEPPVVVMAHGFAAERTFGLPAVAERLAERGYATYLFDYRTIGGSGGEPRNRIDPEKNVADWQAGIARVRRLDGIDASRLALWGVSLGGGHALDVVAEDPRISAVVAQTPVVDGRAFLRRNSVGYLLKGLAAGVRDRLQSLPLVPLGPHTVPIVGDPDEFALLSDPGAKAGLSDLAPPDSAWENETPARAFLSLLRYRPTTSAGDVGCPTLLVSGARDEIAPPETVEAAAAEIPTSTLVRLPSDHFGLYHGSLFEQTLGHAFAFLDANLRSPGVGP
ncbi:alpha/beta hydrolase [Halegenticoccus tardaugens]|uniref:alpha/beta hydrolase n=1 Tax=Halegenticoccus tardaugens TaxID=2071624 RepID=UPI00100B280D|nr:alpha/beta fold hydrolase [Halegenticoccus tardaugens]